MTATPISKAIDPARVGMSKTLMTTPCERKGFYSETVRDERGRRLRFPLRERVTFGSAVDEAVAYIVWHDRGGEPWDADEAVRTGLRRAQRELGWALVPDAEVFEIQLRNAVTLYLSSPDGLARLRALYDENLTLQGNEGDSLRADDVIGTPDFKTDRRVGDLKTWEKLKVSPKTIGDAAAAAKTLWSSPEPGIYALLYAAENGALPESFFYQAYIRVTRPEWRWIEAPVTADLVEYARQTITHWRALLEIGRAELFPTATFSCGDCPFRDPLPEYGHDGCAVGRLIPRATDEEVAA